MFLSRVFVLLSLSLCFASLLGCYQPSASPSPQRTVETLLRLLHDRNAVARRTAAEALGKIGNPQAAPGLVVALGDESPIVREASVRSLGGVGPLDPVTRVYIAGLLVDPVQSVRSAAAQTLGSLDSTKEIWPLAMSQLAHADPEVRRAVIQALESIDSPEIMRALVDSLHDRDPRVRQAAVAVLGESGDSKVVELFRERLRGEPSANVRGEIAYRLQFFSEGESEEGLRFVANHDESAQVRRWADHTLRGLRGARDSGSRPQPIPPAVPEPSHRYP
jgi:HEAT repeat protein